MKLYNVAGIASTVCLCMSCDRMIAPGRTWLKMRCVITEAPGRFQSNGSTDHRMILRPNWFSIHSRWRAVIAPYGGRKRVGGKPPAVLLSAWVFLIFVVTRFAGDLET